MEKPADPLSRYFLYFEFNRGRVAVLNSVKNLSELVKIIKSINPEVLTRE